MCYTTPPKSLNWLVKNFTHQKFGQKMTPAQKQIYLVIDEWWKRFGFGPSIDDVMEFTGEKGRGNVSRKMWVLVDLGVCKGVRKRARSIRPSGLRVRTIE